MAGSVAGAAKVCGLEVHLDVRLTDAFNGNMAVHVQPAQSLVTP